MISKTVFDSAFGKVVAAIIASIGTAAIMLAVQWPSNAVETLEVKHEKDITAVHQRVEALSDAYHSQAVSIAEIRMDVKYIRDMLEKRGRQ